MDKPVKNTIEWDKPAPSQASLKLQTAEEVSLSNGLPPGLSRALRDLGALVKTLSGLGQKIIRCLTAAVVRCRSNISSMMMNRDLRREGCGASSHLLLIALALLLVQGWRWHS